MELRQDTLLVKLLALVNIVLRILFVNACGVDDDDDDEPIAAASHANSLISLFESAALVSESSPKHKYNTNCRDITLTK